MAASALVVATVLTRLPFMTQTLYAFDSANYALAVSTFYNVAFHQPHPPGYPLYVFFARGIDLVVHDADLVAKDAGQEPGDSLDHDERRDLSPGEHVVAERDLLDPHLRFGVLDDPRRVRMSSIPVLFPSPADCRTPEDGYVHVPNVVFSCGMLRRPDGMLVIYYAGNDTVLNVGFSHEDVLAELCVRYGQDPLTGRMLYSL